MNSPFYSRRNLVSLVTWQDRSAVVKRFSHTEDWAREVMLYRLLGQRLPHPDILCARPGLLVTEYCPFPSLLETLEAQERTGFSPEPWQGLAAWLQQCHRLCGQLPADGNLRNFLWDGARGRVVGLDFEEYRLMTLPTCAAGVIAFLLTYTPADTPVKGQAARLLARELHAEDTAVLTARAALLRRRCAGAVLIRDFDVPSPY